jgi:hypothetical protein
MAHQAKKGIPLANGMRLNHGQILGSAPTIATKSTKAKRCAPEPIHDGMRNRTSKRPPQAEAPTIGHSAANADVGKPTA